MKCLSLWQPWATAIPVHLKRIETRDWSTKYRGPLAIHASKHWAMPEREFAAAEHAAGRLPAKIPLGAIVGICELVDVRPTRELLPTIGPIEQLYGNYSDGRFGLVLDKVVAFDEPVPYSGHQGFFNVPDEILPWRAMDTAPKDGTEVDVIFRHRNWQYAEGDAKAQWQAVQRAHWIDFNEGGWVWNGMCGTPIAWRPAA
jgi:activating signal cointegrator 1